MDDKFIAYVIVKPLGMLVVIAFLALIRVFFQRYLRPWWRQLYSLPKK